MTSTKKTQSPQIRFTLVLNATWSVLRDPVLTKMYTRHWKRYISKCAKIIAPGEKLLSLYGYVWNVMYREVQGAERSLVDGAERLLAIGDGREEKGGERKLLLAALEKSYKILLR